MSLLTPPTAHLKPLNEAQKLNGGCRRDHSRLPPWIVRQRKHVVVHTGGIHRRRRFHFPPMPPPPTPPALPRDCSCRCRSSTNADNRERRNVTALRCGSQQQRRPAPAVPGRGGRCGGGKQLAKRVQDHWTTRESHSPACQPLLDARACCLTPFVFWSSLSSPSVSGSLTSSRCSVSPKRPPYPSLPP